MMGAFLGALVVVTGILTVIALPVVILAAGRGRTATGVRFILAAVGIGVFFGLAAVVSDRLVEDCGRSGSIACLDIGYQGLLFLAVVLYVATAVVKFARLWRS